MNSYRKIFALIAVITGLAFVNADAQSFSGPSNTADKNTERQIFRKLIGLPYYGVFDHITFQLQDGTVTLGGKVNSLGTKSDAASALKNVPGVTKVVNNIEQLPPSPSDDTIRRSTLRTFLNRGPSGYFNENNPDVRIIVEHSRVTLEGYVSNSGDYNLLNILANTVPGVYKVTNNLMVGKNNSR